MLPPHSSNGIPSIKRSKVFSASLSHFKDERSRRPPLSSDCTSSLPSCPLTADATTAACNTVTCTGKGNGEHSLTSSKSLPGFGACCRTALTQENLLDWGVGWGAVLLSHSELNTRRLSPFSGREGRTSTLLTNPYSPKQRRLEGKERLLVCRGGRAARRGTRAESAKAGGCPASLTAA